MLLGFGYLCKFVMFSYFFQKAENNRLKKAVGQNFVILFFCFYLKRGSVGLIDQQINLVLPKEYKQRQRLISKSKLNGRSKVMVIKTRTEAKSRYGAGIIQWKAIELKDFDRKSRETITIYGGLHPKSDVDKKGGR